MKRIVICLDGTWNKVRDPATVTNVVKIAQAVRPVASDGTHQIVYYNTGVGTVDLIDGVLGGVFGRGLRSNVQRAYAFLSLNYEPGDQIFIFGFSRGAYTARALAGIVGVSGILHKQEYQNFDIAWNHYRLPPAVRALLPRGAGATALGALGPLPRELLAYAEFNERGKFHRDVPVRCVGVWDTVGSYGVPAGFGLGALSRIVTAWMLRGFHDTEIGKHIEIGLHAVALDEKRRPFAPTFWIIKRGERPAGQVEQVWFCGCHSNIGGGYADTGLSDVSLIWMCARAAELGGLDFDRAFLKDRKHVKPSVFGLLEHSEQGWPVSWPWPYNRRVLSPNAVKVNVVWNGEDPSQVHLNEMVHWSVLERLQKVAPEHWGGKRTYDPNNLRGLVIPPDRVAQQTDRERDFGS